MLNLSALAFKIRESNRLVIFEQTTHIPPATTITLSFIKKGKIIRTKCAGDIVYEGYNETEALEAYSACYVKSENWTPKDPFESGMFV